MNKKLIILKEIEYLVHSYLYTIYKFRLTKKYNE